MSEELLWGIVIALIVGLLAGALLVWSPWSEPKLKIGNLTLKTLQRGAKIADVDNTVGDRLKSIKKEYGQIYIFDGSAIASAKPISAPWNEAELVARGELSRFLNTVVEDYMGRVEGRLRDVITGENEVNEIFTSLFKQVTESFTKSLQTGARIIAKWYYEKGTYTEYHVLLFYDPLSVVTILEQNMVVNDAINKYGEDSLKLFEALNEVFKEAKVGTPAEEK